MRIWRRTMCSLGFHKRLDLIQSFGAGKHVGCPDCRREMAMHSGMRVIIPWDESVEELYRMMGYNVVEKRIQWRAYLHSKAKEHNNIKGL